MAIIIHINKITWRFNRIFLWGTEYRDMSRDVSTFCVLLPCSQIFMKAILQDIRNSLAIPLEISLPRKPYSLKNISNIAVLCNILCICKIQGEKMLSANTSYRKIIFA